MVSDIGSYTEPDAGSSPEPKIRRGLLLPRVGTASGAEQLLPSVMALPPPDGAAEDPASGALRPGEPRWLRVLVGGVCAVALVAVVSVLALTWQGSKPSASAVGDRGPAALDEAPPVPGPTGVRPPEASASARVTASPSHSAKPRAAATARHAGPPVVHHWRTLVVHATYVLDPGDSVRSNRISLSMSTGGDLVLRDERGRVTWSTGTRAQGARAIFQADGNLVVYQGDRPVWSSRTEGHDGATLALQADGAMRIRYGNTVLWSTGTG